MIKTVVVFAGNECKEERRDYYVQMAYTMGQALAEAGFVVATGGGPGLMDAVMKGAYENGGQTIGVCYMGSPFAFKSSYIHEKVEIQGLVERQNTLLSYGDAFIALPGGIGTIYEVCQILALKRSTELDSTKPMLLLSEYFRTFQKMFDEVIHEGFLQDSFSKFYSLVDSPAQAVEVLKKF